MPYVFAGGRAARDIKTFTEVVKLLPDIHFKCVFPESLILPEMIELLNLDIYCNIPSEEFYKIMNGATVCCIPVNRDTPSGLYTRQHAAQMGQPIVSTDTFSMRTIVPDDTCGFLLPMYDAKGVADKVNLLMFDKTLRASIAANAKQNFKKFEPAEVGKQLCVAIDRFVNSVK